MVGDSTLLQAIFPWVLPVCTPDLVLLNSALETSLQPSNLT